MRILKWARKCICGAMYFLSIICTVSKNFFLSAPIAEIGSKNLFSVKYTYNTTYIVALAASIEIKNDVLFMVPAKVAPNNLRIH